MQPIQFFVEGIPKGQPRPRAFAMKFGNKYQARVYDAGTAEGWKSCIAAAAQAHRPPAPLEGPIRLDVDFIFPRPKRLLKKSSPVGEMYHAAKPDCDNCLKCVADVLTMLQFWMDDAQVASTMVRKFYCAIGKKTGARVAIHPSCDLSATPIDALFA